MYNHFLLMERHHLVGSEYHAGMTPAANSNMACESLVTHSGWFMPFVGWRGLRP